jgi:hypothetical protein
MPKTRLDLKRFSLVKDLQGSKMERDEWVFENLSKEQLKSSGLIQ